MTKTGPRTDDGPPARARPVVNTHVHLPPNFSAFDTVEDVVETAAREGVRVIGASNFHDLGVYASFGAAAARAGITALYGIEIITVLADAHRDGIRVNDPENPGRAYVCGKGIPDPVLRDPETPMRLAASRPMNEARAERMVERLRDHLASAGLETDLTEEAIAEDVALRAGVPRAWVVLQERHLAQAFQGALFRRLDPERRAAVLERAYGGPSKADPADAIAVQGELRSRLMKAGRPAFVPETPVSFEEALRLILDLDAIPCYPTLADGADPVCPFEDPATALAERLLALGIHAAELIPLRNRPDVVDGYVAAFRAAGLVVMAGTEHNTPARIPLEPRCSGGIRPSPAALDAFWEGTCIVAAHQHLRSSGRPGYVDREGRLDPGFPDGEQRIRWYRELGAELIMGQAAEVEE